MATCGLGDASIVELNHRRTTLPIVLSATTAATLVAAIASGLALAGILYIEFAGIFAHVRTAVIIAALSLPVSTLFTVLSQVLNADERIRLTSAAAVVAGAISTAALVFLVIVLHWGLTGGVLANAIGTAVGLCVVLGALRSSRHHLRPRVHWEYLRRAIRFGLALEVSYLLVSLTARADLVVVYAIAGRSPAGQYSVALTLAILVAYAGMAIVYAGFPRLARLDGIESLALTAKMFRVAVVAGALVGVALAATVHTLVPLLFGPGYGGTATATLLLLPGGLLYSGQFVLARAAAARGNPQLLVRSFALSLAVMLVLDFATIPWGGIDAAAVSSAVASLAGVAVCLHYWVRQSGSWARVASQLVPRPADVRDVVTLPRTLLARRSAP